MAKSLLSYYEDVRFASGSQNFDTLPILRPELLSGEPDQRFRCASMADCSMNPDSMDGQGKKVSHIHVFTPLCPSQARLSPLPTSLRGFSIAVH